jgi:hypothetical protein
VTDVLFILGALALVCSVLVWAALRAASQADDREES